MTTWQKILKYMAMALAAVFAVAIIVWIVNSVWNLLGNDSVLDEMQVHTVETTEEIVSLDVEISAAEVVIRSGDEFSVESNLKYLTVKTENKTLILSEKTQIFGIGKTPKLYLTVPKDKQFDSVDISTGAGTFTLQTLESKSLNFSFGAGEVNIESLTATEKATINGGAGEINIKNGAFQDLDLDMGVGELNLTACLLGTSKLDCGVGETNVTLLGTDEDYSIHASKGIGAVKIAEQSVNNDIVFGIGENRVEINGGVGTINIFFEEQ